MGWPTKHVYMNVADKHAIQRTVSADQHKQRRHVQSSLTWILGWTCHVMMFDKVISVGYLYTKL